MELDLDVCQLLLAEVGGGLREVGEEVVVARVVRLVLVAVAVAVAPALALALALAFALAIGVRARKYLRDRPARIIVVVDVVGDVIAGMDELCADTYSQAEGLADGRRTGLEKGEEEGDCERDQGFELHFGVWQTEIDNGNEECDCVEMIMTMAIDRERSILLS